MGSIRQTFLRSGEIMKEIMSGIKRGFLKAETGLSDRILSCECSSELFLP
jgi:hypothetical protein